MAISATQVFEVRTGGSDTNGGGRASDAVGDDYTLQDAAQIAVTDGVTAGTATITSVEANFEEDVIGHLVYVEGGTGSVAAGWYEITARPDEATITVDRSTGLTAGTGVTLNVGGALATPGLAASLATVSGNKIYVKNGTYTIATTTPGAAGPVLLSNGVNVTMEGYLTTRGDHDATPTLDAGAETGVTLFSTQGTGTQVFNSMKADGQVGASNVGFSFANNRHRAHFCVAADCATGFTGTRTPVDKCLASGCTTAGYHGCSAHLSVATACAIGFNQANTSENVTCCVAYLCTTDGFVAATTGITFRECTADENARYGFNLGSGQAAQCINCLSTNHSGGSDAGFFCSGTVNSSLFNCAGYNNTANASGTFLDNHGFISLTADPYQNQDSADFRPNSAAGGGNELIDDGVGVYGQSDSQTIGAVNAERGFFFGVVSQSAADVCRNFPVSIAAPY